MQMTRGLGGIALRNTSVRNMEETKGGKCKRKKTGDKKQEERWRIGKDRIKKISNRQEK